MEEELDKLNSAYVLKVKLTMFAEGLNGNVDGKKESNMTFMILAWLIRRLELPFTDLKESMVGTGLGRIRSCAWDILFGMSIRIQVEMWGCQLLILVWNSGRG